MGEGTRSGEVSQDGAKSLRGAGTVPWRPRGLRPWHVQYRQRERALCKTKAVFRGRIRFFSGGFRTCTGAWVSASCSGAAPSRRGMRTQR